MDKATSIHAITALLTAMLGIALIGSAIAWHLVPRGAPRRLVEAGVAAVASALVLWLVSSEAPLGSAW